MNFTELGQIMDWKTKHGVETKRISGVWFAWIGNYFDACENDRVGLGNTPKDAMNKLAMRLGIKLWNE